jgi:hypothetical protein
MIAITIVCRRGYLARCRKRAVAVSLGSDKIVLSNEQSVFGEPKRPPESTNSITNVDCRSVLGSKNPLMSRALRTMIEWMIIIVRWLVSFQSVGALADRPTYTPSLFWAVCALRRRGYRAVGAPPGIGWMTMRLDPVWCVRLLSSPSNAQRESITRFRTPPFGGV